MLRGRCRARGVSWTKLAEPYPSKLCTFLGTALSSEAGLLENYRALDIAACAKCCGARIGEACNPGPRRSVQNRVPGALGAVQLLEPETIRTRERHWSAFLAYLATTLSEDDVQAAFAVPQLLATLLTSYAEVMFDAGASLHYYRQLLAHVQRTSPSVRPFLRPAWEAVTKWETLEPVSHRPPLPLPIFKAMIALAIAFPWHRWACATAIAFFGICRVGEALSAKRSDVFLPSDLLEEGSRILLQIRKPKTRRRGARIQHATVHSDELFCGFICSVLDSVSRSSPICGGSPAMYRRRWDFLLERLGISKRLRLTPGCLRGGGAIFAHGQGLPIPDLLWRMRLTHQTTLAHYLQEVAASSIIPSLPSEVRENIKAAADLFPFFLHG